jgi:hypothetical protein
MCSEAGRPLLAASTSWTSDVTQFAIDKAEADGSGVIDGIEFGQVLGGEGFAFLNGSFGADFVGDVAGEAADDGGVDAGGS